MSDDLGWSSRIERQSLPDDWRDAVDRLQGYRFQGLGYVYTKKHDVKPLARMLRSGKPVPDFVAQIIATLLEPKKGRWTGRLVYEPPPPRAVNFWKNKRRSSNARSDLQKLLKEGTPLKKARYKIAKKYDRSEGWLKGLGPENEEKDFAEAEWRLDPSTMLP